MLRIFIFTGNNENSCTPTVENTNIYYNISTSLLWHKICGSDYMKEYKVVVKLYFAKYIYYNLYTYIKMKYYTK